MSRMVRVLRRSLVALLFPLVALSTALAQSAVSDGTSPPRPSRAHALGASPRLPRTDLPASTIKALVLPSWDGGGALAWTVLNTQWPQFGSTQVVIDHVSLAAASSFTYDQLVASGADVLVLSNPAGGKKQYTPAMIDAVARYARAGHDLIGTYRVFQWDVTYNNGLAPLFGLQDTLRYWPNVTPISGKFEVLQPSSPLLQGIATNGWTSTGYTATQLPQAGMPWGAAGLAGAVPVAQCDGMKGIVSEYQGQGYTAVYFSSMPDYGVGVDDLRTLYNALTYSRP